MSPTQLDFKQELFDVNSIIPLRVIDAVLTDLFELTGHAYRPYETGASRLFEFPRSRGRMSIF